MSSPALQQPGAHRGYKKNEAETLPIFTVVFGGRGDDIGRPAMEKHGSSASPSMARRRGHREVDPELGMEAGCNDGALGLFI
jgi:hypothetical protein